MAAEKRIGHFAALLTILIWELPLFLQKFCLSAAPFITAILAQMFMKTGEKLQLNFFIGFVVAMAGIILISFNGSQLKLNPVGDILAFTAAFVWACYSILTKKTGSFGFPVRYITFCKYGRPVQYFIFGNWGVCFLLCNMELCC